MWEDNRYFWVVLCKHKWFHARQSLSIFFRHRIPLGETDALSNCPIAASFTVRCDQCGKESVYKPSDVMRFELNEPPTTFTPHPLFRPREDAGDSSTGELPIRPASGM